MNNFNDNYALVTAVHRDRYEILFENETQYARLKTACFYNTKEIVDFPTVGDEVEIQYNPAGDSLITKVLPRRTVFLRLNATQGLPDQAVAANFDYVFITMSLNKDFHVSKLERYLTVAWQSGGTPVVILTKLDLCENRDFYINQVNEVAMGVDCYCVSSITGEGFQEMERFFQAGKTVVLLGSSGVGKSSFVNLIMGKETMQTGGIRETDAQGRHTTTYKQCMNIPEYILLPDGTSIKGGGKIIDTPGIRRLVVGEIEEGISNSFEDVENLIVSCKFSNCKHDKEPGCAIKKALENGTLDRKRWQTYQEMQEEASFSRERKEAMMKRISKFSREYNKHRHKV